MINATTNTTGNVLKNAYVARNITWANDVMRNSHALYTAAHIPFLYTVADYMAARDILRYAKTHSITAV